MTTYATLQDVVRVTTLEGPRAAATHYYVKLLSGRWMRTFGLPNTRTCIHVHGRIYHVRGGVP